MRRKDLRRAYICEINRLKKSDEFLPTTLLKEKEKGVNNKTIIP